MEPFSKKISEISHAFYGVHDGKRWHLCHPTEEEIQKAIDEGRLEERSFQGDLEALVSGWKREAKTYAEFCDLNKAYHARRIAHFVVHVSGEPILLAKDGITIKDGLHRFWAAKYRKEETVKVVLEEG